MITSLVLLTLHLLPTLLPASEESGTANYVNTTMTCNPSSTTETQNQHPTRPHCSVTLPWGPQWMEMQDVAGGTHLMNPVVDLWQNWTLQTTSGNTNSLPPCSLVGYTQTHTLPPVIPSWYIPSFLQVREWVNLRCLPGQETLRIQRGHSDHLFRITSGLNAREAGLLMCSHYSLWWCITCSFVVQVLYRTSYFGSHYILLLIP